MQTPTTMLDSRFSAPDASATTWTEVLDTLERAEIFWLSTVRPSGRPHVTPLIAVWIDRAMYFCTGEDERKRKNLAQNPNCILTTGCNRLAQGLDIVVEGKAVRVIHGPQLQAVADAYEAKYGPDWRFDPGPNSLRGTEGQVAWVYRVAPVTVFGFSKGNPYSQTRWSF